MPFLQLKQSTIQPDGGSSGSDNPSVDIIAVHGLDEGMTDAWTDPATNLLWLRDLLPESLNVARVLTFGYNANATSFYGDKSAERIQKQAETLVADLQADRALEGCSQRPIVFVCHGLGGILVKKALAYSSARVSKNVAHLCSIFISTYGILFFGTPHNGIEMGSWSTAACQKNRPVCATSSEDSHLLSAISKDSETLQLITEQFSGLMKQFHIFYFWEQFESQFPHGQGYVVKESSAAPIIDNTERAGIAANHAQMVKFSDKSVSSYRTVIEALGRYCRYSPPLISRRWHQATESIHRAWSNEAFELTGTAFDVHNDNRPFLYERKPSETLCNKHFHIPQVVSSIFTGREEISRLVQEALFTSEDADHSHQQRRYIIYGLGGSGKTQFCSKFAQDHRERFWGIFWIDATSTETAAQSFAKIGKVGGLEPTFSAGKYWLSNLEAPWLLIVNNADDPLLNIVDMLPEGERGCILVTTRNPNLKVHETVGATEFRDMSDADALVLFLRAADVPRPWSPAVRSMGSKITDTLGRLALALIQAGALIRQRICRLDNYLDFYSTFRSRLGSRRASEASSDDDQLTIHATWEHSFQSMENRQTEPCKDATQLLSTVAFFHFDHIRVDIFSRALENRNRTSQRSERPSWVAMICNNIFARLQPPSILPNFLRQGLYERHHFRVRRALNELRSLSLISYDGKNDSFSLHPVVHSWARDRLEKAEQAVWEQVAANLLAESIQLPPGDIGEKHEIFRRDILVHLNSCLQARPINIIDYASIFGGYRFPFALLFHSMWLSIFREQVTNFAKFGYVYLERGHFQEAVKYLSGVKNALVVSRGHENEKTMVAMLALAQTFWGLGRLEEGISLQIIVVDARTRVYGRDHLDTLSAMDQLGKSYWLDGQYKEALRLQSRVVDRSRAILGPTHQNTLSAMDNLGVTYGAWQRYRESRDLHLEVLECRKKMLEPMHAETLTTMHYLAMAYLDLGELEQAQQLANEVYEQRKTKLGKEHPWTLWSLCNLAKVTMELGLLHEAEDMLVGGIAAGKRSLSADHLGVLVGEGQLAQIVARQGRLDESKTLILKVIPRLEVSRGPAHPDTVYGLCKLAELYELRNETDNAVEARKMANQRAEVKLGLDHPLAKQNAFRLAELSNLQTVHDNSQAEGDFRRDHRHCVGKEVSNAKCLPHHLRVCKTF